MREGKAAMQYGDELRFPSEVARALTARQLEAASLLTRELSSELHREKDWAGLTRVPSQKALLAFSSQVVKLGPDQRALAYFVLERQIAATAKPGAIKQPFHFSLAAERAEMHYPPHLKGDFFIPDLSFDGRTVKYPILNPSTHRVISEAEAKRLAKLLTDTGHTRPALAANSGTTRARAYFSILKKNQSQFDPGTPEGRKALETLAAQLREVETLLEGHPPSAEELRQLAANHTSPQDLERVREALRRAEGADQPDGPPDEPATFKAD
jgi:hypothetical protein